jgi:hypothetical protein
VFSDEVSWADRHNISNYQEIIPARLHHRTFVFNVLPTQKTMFSKEDKVTLISGINANCMYLMNALLDFPTFKENLVKMFNDAKLTK